MNRSASHSLCALRARALTAAPPAPALAAT